jgi:uncharacterized protein with PQ loop repeat
MTQTEKQLTEKESLALITQMINKAKDSCHDTGITAIMWGAVIAVCALVKLSELQFGYQLPFDIYLLTLVAVIPQVFISIREKKKRKVKTYDDVFMDFLWLGFGITIFLMIFITNYLSHQLEGYTNPAGHGAVNALYEYISPLFLLLYGLPTFVSGVSMKFKPMIFGGILCWVSCIIAIYTSIKIDLLLTAFSAVFAWLVPGIIMEKDYRKAKRGLAEANV